ncbi:MAG: N-acetylmuramoyl-L-alanine amidase [Paludibacter sp.]|nr:N-acetylmuramoyl-L-alanine amidase [Paludibacter sp.]
MRSTFYNYIILPIFLLFTGISSIWSQGELKIVDKTVSFGMREANNRSIDAIIVHSTFNNSGGEKYDIDLVIKQFSSYGVSSHYVIGRDGTVYQLVKEQNVSYHAGKSQLPDGRTAVNTCSIGIEIMTSFDESPTDEQIDALTLLVNDIKSRYDIKFILRHNDIAPGRKTDPWNMDWDAFLKKLDE